MTTETTEIDVLDRLVPELEADGYEVYLHPSKPLIPGFLGDFRPDAIALRHDKNLVVEVLRRSSSASQNLARIAALLQGREKWELRVLWVEPTSQQDVLQIQDVDTIKARIAEVRILIGGGGTRGRLYCSHGRRSRRWLGSRSLSGSGVRRRRVDWSSSSRAKVI